MILAISLGAFLATLLGGLFALKFKDKLHLILGFSAGAVIGVAFFDLLPEALELGGTTTLVAVGFIGYMILDRLVHTHEHSHDHEHTHMHADTKRGIFGALSFSIHSFLDGIAIGLAFHVSNVVGIVVAVAVLAHDFSDGINTVNLILKNNGKMQTAFRWLIIDACAPVVGVLATYLFSLSQDTLGIVLSVFAGFFLYIGASDLLPESHHSHPRALTTIMTLLGLGVMYSAIKLAGM